MVPDNFLAVKSIPYFALPDNHFPPKNIVKEEEEEDGQSRVEQIYFLLIG